MNKRNVKVSTDGKTWSAEWADRALDDDDRYEADDTIFVRAEGSTEKQMWGNLALALDNWYRETRT